MKQLKILGLLAVAVAAMLTLANPASADSVTSPTGTTYTSTFQASAEGHAVLDNPIAKIECPAGVSGSVESHGSGKAVSGNVFFSSSKTCTDSWHVTTIALGSLSVENNSSGYNGDLRSNGATIETTRFGVSCRYATSNTTIGTLTGGSPATVDLSASIPFHSGSIFCGSGATALTGSFTVNTPSSLFVDNN